MNFSFFFFFHFSQRWQRVEALLEKRDKLKEKKEAESGAKEHKMEVTNSPSETSDDSADEEFSLELTWRCKQF